MSDLVTVPAAALDGALAKARADLQHARVRADDLTRRINGALFLLDQFDPAGGAGHAAVLITDLRLVLGGGSDPRKAGRP